MFTNNEEKIVRNWELDLGREWAGAILQKVRIENIIYKLHI